MEILGIRLAQLKVLKAMWVLRVPQARLEQLDQLDLKVCKV